MNIDERLDRLTERHEALTQTVELLARQAQETERRLASQSEQTERRLDRIADFLDRLGRIVEGHERRISGLEGGS